jgi:hypothetical protein
MIIGTNWFLGFSHCTQAKDQLIKEYSCNPKHIADIIEVFFKAGINAIMGQISSDDLYNGVREAEDRTGVKAIIISTPSLPCSPTTPAQGFDPAAVASILDVDASRGATFCMPHQSTTDSMVDRCVRKVRQMDDVCRMIRERNMIPGLSTHMPESIVYADESGLDVETYISIYNAAGFLMQLEVDWTAKIISEAKKPVMTIKPMAAGQIRPFQALHFVWSTLRPQDMVTVGTLTPLEAQELIDISLQILENQGHDVALQMTRSKQSVMPQ